MQQSRGAGGSPSAFADSGKQRPEYRGSAVSSLGVQRHKGRLLDRKVSAECIRTAGSRLRRGEAKETVFDIIAAAVATRRGIQRVLGGQKQWH